MLVVHNFVVFYLKGDNAERLESLDDREEGRSLHLVLPRQVLLEDNIAAVLN